MARLDHMLPEIAVSPGHAPGHVLRQSPENAGVSRRAGGGRRSDSENADWLAVRTVCSEPVSRVLEGNFPDKQGKNREFREIEPIPANRHRVSC